MSDAGRRDGPPLVAVTLGEPSGVGPDIVLAIHAAGHRDLPGFFVLADPRMLADRAARLAMPLSIHPISAPHEAAATPVGALAVLPLVNRQAEAPGRIDPDNAAGTIEAIDRATALVLAGEASALVTGPIDKKALYDFGFRHPGHTEYLADLCARRLGRPFTPVMLLTGPDLSCVPVTIHIPLAEVPRQLTAELIETTCRIVAADYRTRLGIPLPRLAVSGLNPHAGEKGAIGTEEETVIRPAIERLRASGIDAFGPLPGDTMFHAEARRGYDVAVCMYHDQALIPAKTLAFDQTVNATLGLPIIRTSPDHGTAADIAGTGRARPDSFLAALRLAGRMAAASPLPAAIA
ncbi:4-hydroxythreonine-4-phosphate dehydrogenase PdxA [Aurantimonas endophytica]|uniref:4-hydroxythreonine-4-phosphate dehydrogenase n=1 Tax=Aurantimonas endophytica TaxID=1522175 RepID=A0A7W6H9L0_9HYPH|nr:4-hydroxythreonine-4-phosphate dehydrogenase PdxA [Aurantimonas endophytica]MBB4001027.1 4-hydroxythreonine-4-phosphate dehydrogenase [Aurantimonas endophytica]MCO6403317.1 4-hydroxythreonine-4-phosphate dehydrogenase PdxA [Aurantimonas endophytica]